MGVIKHAYAIRVEAVFTNYKLSTWIQTNLSTILFVPNHILSFIVLRFKGLRRLLCYEKSLKIRYKKIFHTNLPDDSHKKKNNELG
jgi:hypothetical protein